MESSKNQSRGGGRDSKNRNRSSQKKLHRREAKHRGDALFPKKTQSTGRGKEVRSGGNWKKFGGRGKHVHKGRGTGRAVWGGGPAPNSPSPAEVQIIQCGKRNVHQGKDRPVPKRRFL